MATKHLRAHLKLTRTKTPAHRRRKLKQFNAQREGKQNLSHAGEDPVLNVNLCVKFVIPLIFTDIQRMKIRLINKSNAVSFMYRCFFYVTMEHWIVPRRGHCIFVIFVNLTIGSAPITAMRWPSLGKFVFGLADILFVAYHTCHDINTYSLGMSSFGWTRWS